jgi:hypothetical protein
MAECSPSASLTALVKAIDAIREETAGLALDAFQPDLRKRWLVERDIEIILEDSWTGNRFALLTNHNAP